MLNKVMCEEPTRSALLIQQNVYLDEEILLKQCRICLETEQDTDKPIITPCKCKGQMGQVHEECLKTWIVTQKKQIFTACEICKYEYQIEFSQKKVCIPRKVWKTNIENLIAVGCLCFIFLGFSVLQIFLILQILNIYDDNSSNNSESDFLNSPITMIGFCVLVFAFLIPIFFCLLYVIKKILFITKIKNWKILNREPTPKNSNAQSQLLEQVSQRSKSSYQSKNASQLLSQVPKINQTTSILLRNNQQSDYQHAQFI